MSDATAAISTASGTVHWVGTGLSTGTSGLRLVCEQAAKVVLWGRTEERAERRLAELGLLGRAAVRAFDLDALAAELAPGDVLVSMLPAVRHPELVELCVRRGAHFACSSYVSAELRAAAGDAAASGSVVLTEAGLDPGIDHLMAHLLVARGQAALPGVAVDADFTSYCGGVPAVPNDFRYRFSWAPNGVLSALRSPARYIGEGAERTAERPWEATSTHLLDGEPFEVYPNRDSLPFVAQYGLPSGWRLATFVRGTLRLEGWRAAWEPVFATLTGGDDARIGALARDLAARYPMTDTDRDRVVLAVALSLRATDGRSWSGEYLLDLVGSETESAMARCVSLPLAYGITRILSGELPAGLHRAAETPEEAERWLAFLAERGIGFRFRETA
ncbi:saccharopine dehydrogenase family protein [Kitasatospora sp. NPDC052896]|uniref:saccharopine dehydrogenase family protein n=1 Tax=Kitasatospora sp. NPDC052896 TaxID=3364061 RepID=UPI0037C61644